ncbi:MAG: GNAT family N-acetyltransferase [Rhodobacteraceae bacterium]|nr:GNAT family N-acetyltransferase [Paracoccaceae bacterium]
MAENIITSRLVLRPFNVADGDAVVRYLGDIEVSRWLAQVPHPFSSTNLMLFREDGSSRWPELVAVTLNGEVVGAVIHTDHFGYWVAPEFWGRGIATEAATAMIDMIFRKAGTTQIATGYLEGNAASARVLSKLGFRETGNSVVFVRSLGVEAVQVDMNLSREMWMAAT